MQAFEELLAGSVAAHGHLCPDQVVRVRMTMLALHLGGLFYRVPGDCLAGDELVALCQP